MPLHNVGYRKWDGHRVAESTRPLTISETGIRRALTSKWLRRLLIIALLPMAALSIALVLFEQANQNPEMLQSFRPMLRNAPTSVADRFVFDSPMNPTQEEFNALRSLVWSYLLLTLLRIPQFVLLLLVVGIVAPPLISQDLRTRAYLIYFSRPITRTAYIAGKFGTVAAFILLITAVPALLLYLIGVMLSPSLRVFFSTWDLPLRILAASLVLTIPTSLVALAFSSLTKESRLAVFAWFAIWIVGHVNYSVLTAFQYMDEYGRPGPMRRSGEETPFLEPGWRVLLSPFQTIGSAQAYIFGFSSDKVAEYGSFVLLFIVSTAALAVLYRRVDSPMSA